VPYELIDHTGDVGIRVRAPTLEALFAESARALFEILVQAPGSAPREFEDFAVEGAVPPDELREFLAELLYRFTVDHKMYVSFETTPGKVRAGYVPFDPSHHLLRTELKAVTWHQLEAEKEPEGWRAQVIFDV
jgi:SHS2 domain-containing protein